MGSTVETGVRTLEGAKLRFCPILMTSFAFILGCVPLATASGAGALSRQVMGYVVGGMMAVFVIAVLFYLVEKYSGRKPHPRSPDEQRVAIPIRRGRR